MDAATWGTGIGSGFKKFNGPEKDRFKILGNIYVLEYYHDYPPKPYRVRPCRFRA